MTFAPDTPVSVYYFAGNDTDDDPAYGFEPSMTGTFAEALAWLRGKPADLLPHLTIMAGVKHITAVDALVEAGDRLDPPGINWDLDAELFRGGADLRVRSEWMKLREAVEIFLAMPHAEQDKAGIGLYAPILALVGGRPAALGFMTADEIRKVAMEPTCPVT